MSTEKNLLKEQREADKEALRIAEEFERNAEEWEAFADGTFRGKPIPEELQQEFRKRAEDDRRMSRELRFFFERRSQGTVQ